MRYCKTVLGCMEEEVLYVRMHASVCLRWEGKAVTYT